MIRPMLARPSTSASNRRPASLEHLASTGEWMFDQKLDGLRATLYAESNQVKLVNRNGKDITHLFPEITRVKLPPIVLDGEIVANDGTFNTVATRGKQTSDFKSKAKANPCHFVAFDLLSSGGQKITHLPFKVRRHLLRGVISRRRRLVRVVNYSMDGIAMWESVCKLGLEGLVAKRLNSPYMEGVRSDSWIKFKTMRSLTAIGVGYDLGQGQRSHFGALKLALIGDTGPVPIGRVGTGFTHKQTWDIRDRLDAGEPVLVEVQALNRTAGNELRFPVFVGERTDLSLQDATIDQLDELPTY